MKEVKDSCCKGDSRRGSQKDFVEQVDQQVHIQLQELGLKLEFVVVLHLQKLVQMESHVRHMSAHPFALVSHSDFKHSRL